VKTQKNEEDEKMNKLLAILPIAIVAASIGAAQAQSPRLISETPNEKSQTQAQASTSTNLGTQSNLGSPSSTSSGTMGLDTGAPGKSAQNLYPNLIRRSPVPNTGNQCFVDTTLDPITHKEKTEQIGTNCKT
jgi:hypothetical protein